MPIAWRVPHTRRRRPLLRALRRAGGPDLARPPRGARRPHPVRNHARAPLGPVARHPARAPPSDHRFLCSAGRPLVAPLCERHPVFTPDTIGDGGPQRPDRTDPVTRRPRPWLDEVLDALDLDAVHLVGYSEGGWIAGLHAALTDRPDRLSTLTLIEPGGAIERVPRRFIANLVFRGARTLLARDKHQAIRDFNRWMNGDVELTDDQIELRPARLSHVPPEAPHAEPALRRAAPPHHRTDAAAAGRGHQALRPRPGRSTGPPAAPRRDASRSRRTPATASSSSTPTRSPPASCSSSRAITSERQMLRRDRRTATVARRRDRVAEPGNRSLRHPHELVEPGFLLTRHARAAPSMPQPERPIGLP